MQQTNNSREQIPGDTIWLTKSGGAFHPPFLSYFSCVYFPRHMGGAQEQRAQKQQPQHLVLLLSDSTEEQYTSATCVGDNTSPYIQTCVGDTERHGAAKRKLHCNIIGKLFGPIRLHFSSRNQFIGIHLALTATHLCSWGSGYNFTYNSMMAI